MKDQSKSIDITLQILDKTNQLAPGTDRAELRKKLEGLNLEEQYDKAPLRLRHYAGRIAQYQDHEKKPRLILIPPTVDPRYAIKAAESDDHIIIHGSTGAGKDELASFLVFLAREKSQQRAHFVNCARFNQTQIASELFGHKKGAFPGAIEDHRGIIEECDGGILILQEVGALPKEHQALLLQFIQHRTILPVGGTINDQITVTTRLIITTRIDINDEKIFLQDLQQGFTWRFRVPSLAERPADIPVLFHYFLREHDPKIEWTIPVAILLPLLLHDWPGNVRQLQQYCKCISSSHDYIHDVEDYFHFPNNPLNKGQASKNYATVILNKFEPVLKYLPECLKRDPCFNYGMVVLAESAGIRTNKGKGSYIRIEALHDDDEMCSFLPAKDIIESLKLKEEAIFPCILMTKRLSLFEFLHAIYNPVMYYLFFQPTMGKDAEINQAVIDFLEDKYKSEGDTFFHLKKKISEVPVTVDLSYELADMLSTLTLPDMKYELITLPSSEHQKNQKTTARKAKKISDLPCIQVDQKSHDNKLILMGFDPKKEKFLLTVNGKPCETTESQMMKIFAFAIAKKCAKGKEFPGLRRDKPTSLGYKLFTKLEVKRFSQVLIEARKGLHGIDKDDDVNVPGYQSSVIIERKPDDAVKDSTGTYPTAYELSWDKENIDMTPLVEFISQPHAPVDPKFKALLKFYRSLR
ncbi:MAG: sigma 54-interacting transcriptional regulator [bacterium]